jgi:uncharacterized protein (DUF433 family)
MQLEDYFDFITEPVEAIKIKGTRISIEAVLEPFRQGMSPEQIVASYRGNVTLEEAYASITYYLHNKDRIDEYLKRTEECEERHYQEYLRQEPSPLVKRLREIKAQRATVNS